MSNRVTTIPRKTSRSADTGGVEMYELSLPIPLDHQRKLKALTFLNESVQQYLDRYCSDSPSEAAFEDQEEEFEYDAKIRPKIFYPTPGQRTAVAAPVESEPVKGKKGVSGVQMVQLALCFFLLFYLW